MKEKEINSIIESLRNYKASQSKGELLDLIRRYSNIGLFNVATQYIRNFFKEGGEITEFISISDSFPEEIRDFLSQIKEGHGEDEDFDADSFLEMGELLWEIGSPEEAKDNYIKAFEYYNIQGDSDAAGEVLNTLRERYPDDSEVENLKPKNLKEKLFSLMEELKGPSAADEVNLRYSLAKKMHENDLLPEAEENYKRVIELQSDHKARRYLVALLNERHSLEEAVEYARELEKDERVEELYSLIESFNAVGNKGKANSLLRDIYEIDPDYKDVKELLNVEEEEKVKKEISVEEEREEIVSVEEQEGKEVKEEKEKKKIVFL